MESCDLTPSLRHFFPFIIMTHDTFVLETEGPETLIQVDATCLNHIVLLPSPKDSERVLHLGPFVYSSMSVCLSVCLSAQNFRVCLRSRLSDREEIFTIGATTHAECFNDNYDVVGHVVWQP